MTTEFEITWSDEQTVTAVEYRTGSPMMVLAHGAGTDQHHPMVSAIADAIAAAGHGVMTFNYPYTEAGRRAPDRAPKLFACHRAVAEHMATMLASEGADVDGIVCLAYPLHPAGKPDRLRVEHLPRVIVPVLFFQGSRDSLSRPELFDEHVRPLPNATVVDMEGADHSFRERGWTLERVQSVVTEGYEAWLGHV